MMTKTGSSQLNLESYKPEHQKYGLVVVHAGTAPDRVVEMANPEHVKIVKRGTEAIRKWNQKHPGECLDLSEADFAYADLHEIKLLWDADLTGANLLHANLFAADILNSNLSNANLYWSDLSYAHLGQSNLTKALLSGASLQFADLYRAKLSFAGLRFANLGGAKLHEADLSNTELTATIFYCTEVDGANFTSASMDVALISGCDLSQCLGLETVNHRGPSSIGFDTLVSSYHGAGNLLTAELETFFLNAGVPKQLLDALPKILGEAKYGSCFVCYGEPDKSFAENLVKDLRAKGVSCWLYSMDYTPGKRIWKEIRQMRQETEKMIVLCSARALVRDGVQKEIEEQIDEEPDKIVPISLDNLWKEKGFRVMRGDRDLKPFIMERNYVNFDHRSKYNDSLRRLLRGIERAEE